MAYASVPIIALVILIITNWDLLFRRKTIDKIPAHKQYRLFLISVGLLYIADLLWGLFEAFDVHIADYAVTVSFFALMSVSVWLWSFYVVAYLGRQKYLSRLFTIANSILMALCLILLIINFFHPILFQFVDGEYQSLPFRTVYFISQGVVFSLASIYTLIFYLVKKDEQKRVKYISITIFGLGMGAFIALQVFLPQAPIYSFGYLFGLMVINTFVVAEQKKEYRTAVEEGKKREREQVKEIGSAKELAYTDALTGVYSRIACVELEQSIDKKIADNEIGEFSLIVFDLNDLKLINDKLGHYTGDQYIINAVKEIKEFFPETPLYRYGGDEFVAYIEKEDYKNRREILDLFNKKIDGNYESGEPIVSTGISDYRPGLDNTFRAVFLRADERMYVRKRQLKEKGRINLSKVQKSSDDNESEDERLKKIKEELIRIREESMKVGNSRIAFYKTFYQNEEYSLIDLLNNSSCDEIVEINLNDNTFKQLFHVDGKYFVPTVDSSYSDLFEFTSRYIVHPDDREIYNNLMRSSDLLERLDKGEIHNFLFDHFRYKMQDGDYRYVEQCVITGEENGIPPGIVRLYIFDIHNYKARQNGNIANEKGLLSKGRDSITNLLLEKEFLLNAQKLLDNHPDEKWCLISMDIEHFRFFDEWYGRESGNNVLAKIGELLAAREKEFKGLSGYFGKDDFSIVMPYNQEKIEKLYDDIKNIIYSFGATAGFLPAFGVAMIEKGLSLVDAFDRSTIASAKAKDDIRNRIWLYNSEMQFLVQNEYHLLSEFMNALKNDEITFYLQPQCRISSKKIVGVEALTRWIKKDGTIVSPAEFVPVLEKYGFIPNLDMYMWEKVCASIREWLDTGHKCVPCSINVSRADLFSIDITNILVGLTKKYQVPSNLIKVEITESSYVEASDLVDKLVNELREKGFSVLMDDFGSGYSSLNMLSNLKLDAIKLDARFLKIEDETDSKALHILESVVNMAKTIGLPIIVEGVETQFQSDFLEDLGCRYIQGYFFYRPMPVEEFRKLIADENMIDDRGFVAKLNEQVRIREFLDKNIYSDSMLNNIIGPVAFYSWDGKKTDIVRFNEQFYQAVHVNNFAERLVFIEQFIHPDDCIKMHDAFRFAMMDKLNGHSETLRFFTPSGTVLSFFIHFYYLGKKEGGERFYGAAHNVTELTDLKEEVKLIANYSKDSLLFLRKIDDDWYYSVASRGLSDIFDITPVEFEKELNEHEFAKKRVVSRKKHDEFMKTFYELAKKKGNFEGDLEVYDSSHHVVTLHVTFTCVSGQSNNIAYVLRATYTS
ncbi:MAG: EAL domain-containing protein [Bacilli bacterium]|nr:EAL domain-containing protein [Bacilli bacterium]